MFTKYENTLSDRSIVEAYNKLSDINLAQNNYKEALINIQKSLEVISIDFFPQKGFSSNENRQSVELLVKSPPLVAEIPKRRGGLFTDLTKSPKKIAPSARFLYTFLVNLAIFSMFLTSETVILALVSIFSRLRRTFLPNVFVLQTGTLFETSCTL